MTATEPAWADLYEEAQRQGAIAARYARAVSWIVPGLLLVLTVVFWIVFAMGALALFVVLGAIGFHVAHRRRARALEGSAPFVVTGRIKDKRRALSPNSRGNNQSARYRLWIEVESHRLLTREGPGEPIRSTGPRRFLVRRSIYEQVQIADLVTLIGTGDGTLRLRA